METGKRRAIGLGVPTELIFSVVFRCQAVGGVLWQGVSLGAFNYDGVT